MSPDPRTKLLDMDDCCLVVIDVQDVFLNKLKTDIRQGLMQRTLWIVQVAMKLNIPLVVTAEDISENGSVCNELSAILPPSGAVFNKMSFGLAADQDILQAIEKTQRQTCVLIGLETDVCVAQSAIGLVNAGYQVAALEDACGSPQSGHERGLKRMQGSGVLISNIKAVYYEWLRDVPAVMEFNRRFRDEVGDPGIIL